MRTKTKTYDTATTVNGDWIPLDTKRETFAVSFYVDVQGTGTYGVQHCFHDGSTDLVPAIISRAATVATVTFGSPHGLKVGDSLQVEGNGAALDGTFDVASIVSAVAVTYTVANSGVTTSPPGGARIRKLRTEVHSTVTAKTTSISGNYAFPIFALRLQITTPGVGNYSITVTQGSIS